MYKRTTEKNPTNGNVEEGHFVIRDNASWIPFDPANTDYQLFKSSILSASAELQNANGELMTTEDATNFVKELP